MGAVKAAKKKALKAVKAAKKKAKKKAKKAKKAAKKKVKKAAAKKKPAAKKPAAKAAAKKAAALISDKVHERVGSGHRQYFLLPKRKHFPEKALKSQMKVLYKKSRINKQDLLVDFLLQEGRAPSREELLQVQKATIADAESKLASARSAMQAANAAVKHQ